ncbi:MAG: hypothetical protein IPK00_24690 [Deltaproteobacteria bacterium]|nr:hypothetical protein [Deltaproteobacteria bacterium]
MSRRSVPSASIPVWGVLFLTLFSATASLGVVPNHPVITEVYRDAPGNDGPVGRNPANLHQEFIEIYIPPLASLSPALAAKKDSLQLTFFEVEGDSSSAGLGTASYRIDLPAFDLDPSNGLTGRPRPPSGIVVLGWVDYVGSPPTALAGTPGTRVGLVNGGITSATDYTFIAINGGQFGGTTNFPVPVAVSHLDLVTAPSVGKIEEGAAVYLLVDRTATGYVAICGNSDPSACNAFPDLASGLVLRVSCLLDAFATNDDADFRVDKQPYDAPTGDNIDLEFILPLGGAFSLRAPQLVERGEGHQRVFVDWAKTTEDVPSANDDPVVDALTAYRDVQSVGPFSPTPGISPLTTSAARLGLADSSVQLFDLLAGTTAHAGLVAANLGGNFGITTTTSPGPSSTPALVGFSSDVSTSPATGQAIIGPSVRASIARNAPNGLTETIPVSVSAAAAGPGDPPVGNPSGAVTATYRVIDPVQGLTALGQPFQATAFVAAHGLRNVPGVANELATTSFAGWAAPRLGTLLFSARGNGATLLAPTTDLSNPAVVDPLIATLPDLPANYINVAGPPGRPDLTATVAGSAEQQSGAGTYDDGFNGTQTRVKAREFVLAQPARTTGGGFVPTERVHYADGAGQIGSPNSGLSNVETQRDFELMLVETHLGPTGVLEDGETDDFGLVVRAAQVSPGSPIVAGEFVFLSMMGGLQGADVDSLNLPPGGTMTSLVYVDLEPLGTALGVQTIDRVYVVDGSGTREAEFLEVFSVPEPGFGAGLMLGGATLSLLRRSARRARSALPGDRVSGRR